MLSSGARQPLAKSVNMSVHDLRSPQGMKFPWIECADTCRRLDNTKVPFSPSPVSLLGAAVGGPWYRPTVRVEDFDFELPDELIAQQAAPRGTSRLLVLHRG